MNGDGDKYGPRQSNKRHPVVRRLVSVHGRMQRRGDADCFADANPRTLSGASRRGGADHFTDADAPACSGINRHRGDAQWSGCESCVPQQRF